jgi:hypothetical protein
MSEKSREELDVEIADATHSIEAPAGEPRSPLHHLATRGAAASVGPRMMQRKLQRRAARNADDNGVASDAEHAVESASSSSGSPLPAELRRKFEGSLGADLSPVRVHTNESSQAACEAVSARAYATGNDIHFASGQYDPSSEAGQHLLAHEVAHTQQQAGATARPQNKLEVSTPGDAHEIEADRAADAMVVGAPAQLHSHGGGIARKMDTDDFAAEGEKAAMAGMAKNDIVIKVSNATDTSEATKALALLEDNQPKLEEAVRTIDENQRGPGEYLEAMAHGKSTKLLTKAPVEAIGVNAAVINDLKLYLAKAGGQHFATNEFQDQYKVLTATFGRLDGIAKGFGAVVGLKDATADDIPRMVSDAAGTRGYSTDDLSGTFAELQKDPGVAAASKGVQDASQAVERCPDVVSDAMNGAVGTFTTFSTAIVNATVAQQGVNSLALRNALQEAQAKGESAKAFTEQAMEVVKKGGEKGFDKVKEGALAAGTMAMGGSKWAELLTEGAATGGEALAMEAGTKLVVEPAKKLLDLGLRDANAAVGIIDEKAQVDADLDEEKQKQDNATIESLKTAKAALAGAQKSALEGLTTYVKAALDFEQKKATLKNEFTQLAAAIKKAAGARGKSGEGKALAEMTGFLHEAEQFITQANTVIDMGKKSLGAEHKDLGDSVAHEAREALKKIDSSTVWMAYSYQFKSSHGMVTRYGANPQSMQIFGPGWDASPAEMAGQGRADGFNNEFETSDNSMSANGAIGAAVPQLEGMRDKVLVLRGNIMSEVFGATGVGTPT